MSEPRRLIKNVATLIMVAACGAAAGIGARRMVQWYNEGEWRPEADSPALHGRFATRLAWSGNEKKTSFDFGD